DNLITLRAVIADTLPGARLITAQSGAQGLALALTEDPDVILLDIIMPDMDGFAVCIRLKQDERLRHIPVVFLTANKASRESRIRALEVGAEAFLAKPIDETELVAQVRSMAKIKAMNMSERHEKEYLAGLVAARTRALEQELAERRRAELERMRAHDALQRSQAATLNLLEDLKAEIDARSRSEEALREGLRKLEGAEQIAHIGSYEIDVLTGAASWSAEVFRIFGLDPAVDHSPPVAAYRDSLHPDDVAAVFEHFDRSVTADVPYDLVYRIRRADGEIRHVHSLAETVKDEQGRVVRLFGTFQDVTERIQHERELEVVAALSRALRSAATRGEMLPIILDQIMTLLDADGADLETYNERDGSLFVECGSGTWEKLVGERIPPGGGFSALILADGQPV
ncbi:response regulator, partial [bacterium]|nr:response regulator [bacterium]